MTDIIKLFMLIANSEQEPEPEPDPEQEPCEDVICRDCDKCAYYDDGANDEACNGCFEDEEHLNFKPKEYKDGAAN